MRVWGGAASRIAVAEGIVVAAEVWVTRHKSYGAACACVTFVWGFDACVPNKLFLIFLGSFGSAIRKTKKTTAFWLCVPTSKGGPLTKESFYY